MFSADSYQLLDFGQGRKLERFGTWVLDRPAPASDALASLQTQPWTAAQARYERLTSDRGVWQPADALPPSWSIHFGQLQFELKPTEFGHIGLFPEQVENWAWIAEQVARSTRQLKVLNLFAYTGASTLAAAAAGAEVVHVDAAKNIVQWARGNAQQSGLTAAPIRWIVEDAAKFVEREVRRGNRYDAVILDPPSYGHGPAGERWKFAEDLDRLLANCGQLVAQSCQFLLLTCHTPGIHAADLANKLGQIVRRGSSPVEAFELHLATPENRRLPSGLCARWACV